jgi:Na+-transporting methylmalonyl-CoA/oxaloacetate decarboxylase beta subunit
MHAFSHGFSWIPVDIQLALKETYIKKYPFFKKIILVIIFIVLFLAIKNDFAPLYLGILGIAIVSWVTTPNKTP